MGGRGTLRGYPGLPPKPVAGRVLPTAGEGILTRIIAGFAGSLRLIVPGKNTRPTSDRVREAVFSALDARDLVQHATVLDLYAGSGALGLEAASRGAASVTLVDLAIRTAAANARSVVARMPAGSPLRVVTAASGVAEFLASTTGSWNLVFLDPPYELGPEELGATLTALPPRLDSDATVLLERAARDPAPTWPVGLRLNRTTRYGDTVVYWLEPD